LILAECLDLEALYNSFRPCG